jgi:hypothetical protein
LRDSQIFESARGDNKELGSGRSVIFLRFYTLHNLYYDDRLAIDKIKTRRFLMQAIQEFIFGNNTMYWYFALFASFIAVLQLILSLVFGGGDSDIDSDGHVDFGEHADTGFGDFKLISLRSIVSFFAFFGWGGVISYENGIKGLTAFFIAIAAGMAMMFITALMLYAIMKMQHSGNIKSEEYIGASGTVYLKIPGGRSKFGKVTAVVKGTQKEIVAIADEEIERGAPVKIVKLIDSRRYLVERI